MEIFDLIIIGAGPAGITAAIYAARKRMNFLVLSKDIGGQAAWSGDIENYTGYQFISGPELALKFEEHMRKFAIKLKENEEVRQIGKEAQVITVKSDKGAYKAKTAIIASGKKSRKLGVPGENEFKNKGLTYCVTCDGPLFSGKEVAVIGGGNSALDAAIQLGRIASRIYIINIAAALTGDKIMQEAIEKNKNITVLNNSRVLAVLGEKMVNAIDVSIGVKKERFSVEGVLVEAGLIPNSGFAIGVDKNELGEIRVNCRNETNIPGVFAAGDVTDVPEKQIVIAAGEGSKAALGAFRYFIRHA